MWIKGSYEDINYNTISFYLIPKTLAYLENTVYDYKKGGV